MPYMYQPNSNPQGVPNPWEPAVHPYPSYEHGPDYTRPVFSMPFVNRPYNVRGVSGTELTRKSAAYGIGAAFLASALVGALSAPRRKLETAIYAGIGGAVLGWVTIGGIFVAPKEAP